MKIWAQTLIKNEERYIWFSLMSVIDYVDKIMVWDTGSSDNTVNIVKEVMKKYPKKIDFREMGEVDVNGYTVLRQKMLNETFADWFMILDGDEVWWQDSIANCTKLIRNNGKSYDTIVTPFINVVGDVYHHLGGGGCNYVIDGKRGCYTIRFMNKNIPGLITKKPHGQHGYFDGKGTLIQERDAKRRFWMENYPFLHFTNVQRSDSRNNDLKVPKRNIKLKYEIGKSFTLDFYYPEVFFKGVPRIVGSPWKNMTSAYKIKSVVTKPLKKLKNMILKSGTGY